MILMSLFHNARVSFYYSFCQHKLLQALMQGPSQLFTQDIIRAWQHYKCGYDITHIPAFNRRMSLVATGMCTRNRILFSIFRYYLVIYVNALQEMMTHPLTHSASYSNSNNNLRNSPNLQPYYDLPMHDYAIDSHLFTIGGGICSYF
jgi:hypothetical protein